MRIKCFLFVVMALCLMLCLYGCNYTTSHTTSHTFIAEEVIAPTCSKEGYTLFACTSCGFKTKGDFVSALHSDGHNYVDYVCTECGYFLADEAMDTVTLRYEKIIDDNGKEVYMVMGNTTDSEYIKIPSTYNGIPVTQIADEAFWNSLNLKHVVIPDSIVSIGNSAFKFCFNLTSIIIPTSVIQIGKEAFWDCHNLETISLASVTEINHYAFIGCKRIVNIVIPDNVTTIGVHAFGDCYGLTSITIPASVTKIFHGAFWNDYNLKEIFYEGTIEQWHAIIKEVGDYANTNEDASWDAYTREYTVYCSDGNIEKSN